MKRRRQTGFTLLETLVALVLMSLLLLALFGGFRAGIASWRIAGSHIEQTGSQLLLGRVLHRHLAQIVVTSGNGGANNPAGIHSFAGAADRIRYIAPLALAVDNQLYGIELASEPDGREGVWIRYVPYEGLEGLKETLDEAEYVQVDELLRIRFSYFVDEEWQEELEVGVVPKLVRVHWSSAGRTWSDTTYAVAGF